MHNLKKHNHNLKKDILSILGNASQNAILIF